MKKLRVNTFSNKLRGMIKARKLITAMAFPALLLCSLFSCEKRPDGVLSEKKMVELLSDIEIAEAYFNVSAGPKQGVSKKTLVSSVLKKHGVTQAEFDSTVAYYSRNLDDYYLLYEKVEKNLRAQNIGTQSTRNLEEDNMWPYSQFASVFDNQITDGITFSIPAQDLQGGTSLEWQMRVSAPQGVEALLGVEYENGSSSFSKKSAAGSRSLKISLQTDTALRPKRIFGTMTVPVSSMPLWVDSIRLIRQDFDSLTYDRIRQQRNIWLPQARPVQTSTDEPVDTLPVPQPIVL